MTDVIVIGAGGHAKVIIEILRETPDWRLVGCLSRQPAGETVSTLTVLGGDEDLPLWLAKGVRHAFVAIGDNATRARVATAAGALGFRLINAVSTHAVVSPSAVLGNGVAVMGGVVINAESKIGDGSIVNTGATVDHDCRIGAYCHVAPGTHLAGGVTLGEGVFLGIGGSIIPRVTIGEWTTVGAGAVVTRDIPARAFATGVPARVRASVTS